MKRILCGMFVDLVLILAFWQSGPARIVLLLGLACGNMLFYLFSAASFLYRTGRTPERKGYLLEFVILQIFLCTGVFLYKLTDLLILHDAR